MSISRSGVSSSASASASARTRRPSASVLPISTLSPLRERIDVERPERVAGDRILHRRDQHAQRHLQARVHDHVRERQHGRRPAHVLLHQQHGAVGLEIEPAGVEAHALADQRHLGIARPCPSAARSAAARAARRRRGRRRGSAGSSASAGRRRRSQRTFAPCRLASARAAASSSAGPMSLAGVLMRSRASVTPSAMRRQIVAVDAVGQHQPHRLVLRLAIAREAVGAEREGERGEPRRRAARWRSDRCRPAARRGAGRAGRRSCRPCRLPGRTARRRCRRSTAAAGAGRAGARSPRP